MPQKTVTPSNDVLSLYNTRIKIFPHEIKIACFSRAIFNPDGILNEKPDRPLNTERENEIKQSWAENNSEFTNELERAENLKQEKKRIRNDSMKRAKDKAMEIAFMNEWQFFITFTLDSKNIDRYDKVEILRCFKNWLDNMTRRHKLKYLIFPEFHKDNAVHFHGLCSGDLNLACSGKYTEAGSPIYNCLNWSLGFTSVVRLDNAKERIVNYIMKYISKDNKRVFGNAYFAGGKGLIREAPTEYNNMSFDDLEGKEYHVPDTGMRVKYQTIRRENDDETNE